MPIYRKGCAVKPAQPFLFLIRAELLRTGPFLYRGTGISGGRPFRMGPENLVSHCRDAYGHERRDDVEKTVRQVIECRDLQDSGLRHAARVPRYQNRSHCGRVFDRAAQKPFLIPFLLEEPFVEAAREDDGYVLVTCDHVAQEPGPDSRAH